MSHCNSLTIQATNRTNDGKRIVCVARYGGDEYVFHGESFRGARLDAFCGGIRMDLREAVITEDEEIDMPIASTSPPAASLVG